MIELADVTECGLALPQDLGRHGLQPLGIPGSGALHRLRYRVASLLLGCSDPASSPPGPPVVELLDGVLALRARVAFTCVVVGAASVSIDDSATPTGCVIALGAGQELRVEASGAGPVYVGINGWRPVHILGSASYDTFSKLGPAPLTRGTVLLGVSSTTADVGTFHRPFPDVSGPLRVLAGVEGVPFIEGKWTVKGRARSGVRLTHGHSTELADHSTRPSNPVVVGAIQIPASGEPVILGVDGGLTGGYAVAGVVATADVDRLADVVPGQSIELTTATRDEAWQANDGREAWLRRCIVRPDALH